MNALSYPFANLRGHLARSLLTAAGVGAALAGMLALLGLSRGADRSVVLAFKDRGTDIVAVKKGTVDFLTADLDEGLTLKIRAVPGVISVMGSMGDLVTMNSGEMTYIAGWPLDSDFWRTLPIVTGRAPTADETNSAVLGESLAEALGKKPGDTLELSGEIFRIVGIARQQSVIDDRSVMLPMPVIQRLLDRPGKVSGFHIRVEHPEDPAEVARVRDRIAAAFPDLLVVEPAEMASQSEITNLVRAMAWASSTVALVMTFVVVLNTLLMAVTERMHEIGLLSAIGWHPARIVAAIVSEGLLLSGAGAVLGVAGGLLGLQWMIHNPRLGVFLQPDVTPALALESVAMVLAVGVLGGIYPAWRATRLHPVELLRGE